MNYTKETLFKLIDKAHLTEREVYVLKARIDNQTLESIGEHFARNKERIRQVEAKACRKLSHPSRWGVPAKPSMSLRQVVSYDWGLGINIVDELDIPTQVKHRLWAAGFNFIAKVDYVTDKDLLGSKGLGKTSVRLIREAIKSFKLNNPEGGEK